MADDDPNDPFGHRPTRAAASLLRTGASAKTLVRCSKYLAKQSILRAEAFVSKEPSVERTLASSSATLFPRCGATPTPAASSNRRDAPPTSNARDLKYQREPSLDVPGPVDLHRRCEGAFHHPWERIRSRPVQLAVAAVAIRSSSLPGGFRFVHRCHEARTIRFALPDSPPRAARARYVR